MFLILLWAQSLKGKNMKSFIHILTAVILLTFGIKTQASSVDADAPKGTIKGVFVDQDDNSPVIYANVVLYSQPDSVMTSWTVTSDNGNFELEKVPNGSYQLIASFIGYEKIVIAPLVVESDAHDLGTIKMVKETQTIGDVEVVALQKSVDSKIDKKVIDVSKDINSSGGTAIDALRNVPGLTVDAEGIITMRGNSELSILVNGRPTSINTARLDRLPASAIEKIEIITNPSAKYNPEGKNGIINLRLKPQKASGLNGNALFTAGTGDKYNGLLDLNYNFGNVNLFASWNANYRQTESTRWLYRESYFIDIPHFLQQDVSTSIDRQSNKFTLGSNININEQNSLLLSFSANPSKSTDTDQTTSQYFDPTKILAYSVLTDNMEFGEEKAYDLVAGYRKTFLKEGEELTADYSFFSTNGNHNQPETFLYPDKTREIEMFTDFSDYNSNLQINWVLPFTPNSKIESGIQSIVRGSSNNFTFFEKLDGSWMEDLSQKDLFNYNEQMHSLYGIWSADFNKLSVTAGMRLEQTFISGEQSVTDNQIDQKYFNFYPSFSIMQEIGKDANIILSYSRRINRPNARMLNPFSNISNPEVIRSGNPDLKPEYVNSFELGYNKSWGKTTIGASVFYSFINDVINMTNILDSAGISHMYPINADWAQNYGAEFSFDQIISKWWKINGNASILRNNVQGLNIDEKNSNFSYNGRINSTWNPSKSFSIQLSGYLAKPAVGLYTSVDPQTSVDLALKKDFSPNFSMTLRASDIFNTLKSSYTSWGDDFITDNMRKSETRVVYLSLSYKFGGGEIFKGLKAKKEEEMKPTLEMLQ